MYDSTQAKANNPNAAWKAAPRAHRRATSASIAKPMPHWRQKTPRKITRLKADKARPAAEGENARATAGWLKETTVQDTHHAAHQAAPAAGPNTTAPPNSRSDTGVPKAMRRLTCQPQLERCGIAAPQPKNAINIERLIRNRSRAAPMALCPATWVSQGPAHKDCTAIKPP